MSKRQKIWFLWLLFANFQRLLHFYIVAMNFVTWKIQLDNWNWSLTERSYLKKKEFSFREARGFNFECLSYLLENCITRNKNKKSGRASVIKELNDSINWYLSLGFLLELNLFMSFDNIICFILNSSYSCFFKISIKISTKSFPDNSIKNFLIWSTNFGSLRPAFRFFLVDKFLIKYGIILNS